MMMALRALLVEFEAMLPRSLLGRSIMIIVTPVVLLQVVSAWVFYDSHWNTVTRRPRPRMRSVSASTSEARR